MALDFIRIRGARTHNLKNIDLDLPRDKLIVITGPVGLGQVVAGVRHDLRRRPAPLRRVAVGVRAAVPVSVMEKPDVDHIEGLSPAISIEQKSTSHNPRSTVGTITEIYDYLRLLYARVGTPRCPDHDYPLEAQTVSQMVDQVIALASRSREQRYMLLAPVVRERKGEHAQVFEQLRAQGYVRVRVDGVLHEIDAVPPLALRVKHTIEAVIDRFKPRDDLKQRLAESFETALKLGDGMAAVHVARRRRRRAAAVLVEVQLPGLRLLAAGTGTAPVLVQLAGRRLPDLRRPGRGAVLRSRRAWSCIRSCRSRPARCAAGTAATPTTSS